MKNVRIYKDDIRTNILRSLFFTDTVIALVGATVIAVILFVIFKYILLFFDLGYYMLSLLTCEIFFLGFITQKIDNQPIYKIVPRSILYKSSKKNMRHADIDPYFTDFNVQDNLIIQKNSIIKMFEIEPFDIALLNDQDREHFFVKLKQTIHVLPARVQFLVRKERAKIADYSKHFFSLYNDSNSKREKLIHQYCQDLSSFIRENPLISTHHYAIFSVSCNTQKQQEKIKAVKKLGDISLRFASSIASCNIGVLPLENDELLQFAKNTLR